MHLDIKHLKLMVAVTEEKSVTKAGERLHLTQSALSHQLRDLEERLGTPLFLRLNKKMVLTQAGERLLQSAQQVLGELKHAEADLKKMAASDQGTLRLITECYTCYYWLPELLREFSRKFPKVEVNIALEATQEPLPALLNGKVDIAIVADAPHDARITYRPLFKDELVAIMPPDHPLASRPYWRAQDFDDQHLFLCINPKNSHLYEHVLNPAGIKPARFSQVQLVEAIIEFVKAGLGISALAQWAVQAHLDAGTLVARSITRKGLHRQWSAALLRNDFQPVFINEFVTMLANSAMPFRRAA